MWLRAKNRNGGVFQQRPGAMAKRWRWPPESITPCPANHGIQALGHASNKFQERAPCGGVTMARAANRRSAPVGNVKLQL